MLRVDFALEKLTMDELEDAVHALHHDLEELEFQDHLHQHPELAHLFEALEQAVQEERAIRDTLGEKHEIALALGIDEDSGEWLAGA